jgi:nicotinate phosphoribosyltransferase
MGESALGGVYKLVAVCHEGDWKPAIKISESPNKTPNPGYKRVWRLYDRRGKATADLLTLDGEEPGQMDRLVLRHPSDHTKYRMLARETITEIEPLMVTILQEGKLVYELPTIEEIRQRREADLDRLDPGVRRLMNPHLYHVSLSTKLWNLKGALIESMKGRL